MTDLLDHLDVSALHAALLVYAVDPDEARATCPLEDPGDIEKVLFSATLNGCRDALPVHVMHAAPAIADRADDIASWLRTSSSVYMSFVAAERATEHGVSEPMPDEPDDDDTVYVIDPELASILPEWVRDFLPDAAPHAHEGRLRLRFGDCGGACAGVFSPKHGRITVDPAPKYRNVPSSPRHLLHTVLHEVGHSLDVDRSSSRLHGAEVFADAFAGLAMYARPATYAEAVPLLDEAHAERSRVTACRIEWSDLPSIPFDAVGWWIGLDLTTPGRSPLGG